MEYQNSGPSGTLTLSIMGFLPLFPHLQSKTLVSMYDTPFKRS